MKALNIVLSVLLAVAIVTGIIIYQRYADKKDAILSSEKKVSSMEEKVAQLGKENAAFREQIQMDAKKFEELQDVEKRISKLKDALNAKNEELAEFQEKFETIKRESEEQKKTTAALQDRVSSKESLLKGIKVELQTATSQAHLSRMRWQRPIKRSRSSSALFQTSGVKRTGFRVKLTKCGPLTMPWSPN